MSLQKVKTKNKKKRIALAGAGVAATAVLVLALALIPNHGSEASAEETAVRAIETEMPEDVLLAKADVDVDEYIEDYTAPAIVIEEKVSAEEKEEQFRNIESAHDYVNFENLIREIAQNTAEKKVAENK
ncbi:hypothetical protein bpr_II312 (plasmid) [Butyrivibrio proteoclasticus B316]|uniref:Uncharacterized protein n=1 Tax=Butyrivibrio proteoclasticus (strain ATCC 51982 / DSM 14932 / B316) TaxID=515622 RepID=E0S4B7_BUTPB|nr:hypothetical protein [Butyrivibrio proteoclasticus]ADL36249.1 hypothetical protein bpr_II312 [Butyrivibrio proteoclasticus B316]